MDRFPKQKTNQPNKTPQKQNLKTQTQNKTKKTFFQTCLIFIFQYKLLRTWIYRPTSSEFTKLVRMSNLFYLPYPEKILPFIARAPCLTPNFLLALVSQTMWNFLSLPGWVSLVCQGFCFLCSVFSHWKINVEIKSWTQINQHSGAVKDFKPRSYLNNPHHISSHRSKDLLRQNFFLTPPICTSSEEGQGRSESDTRKLQLKRRITNHKVKQPPPSQSQPKVTAFPTPWEGKVGLYCTTEHLHSQ